MSNIVNEPPQNENITFNNQLINDVINFCNNKEKDKLTNIIAPLHPADLADLFTFLSKEQRCYILYEKTLLWSFVENFTSVPC